MTKLRLTLLTIFWSGGILLAQGFSIKTPLSFNRAGQIDNRRSVCLQMLVPTPFDTLTSGLASIVRIPNGVEINPRLKKPSQDVQVLKLYDIENNNACRLVREKITELDLVVESVIPSAKNSRAMSSKHAPETIPLLVVQENRKEISLKGTDAIISYLNSKFLDAGFAVAEEKWLEQFIESTRHVITGSMASFFRLGRGDSVSSAALATDCPRPKKKLVLYNYEGNQFCRLVREVLTELDLVYEMRSTGKMSPRRMELASISSDQSSQCPHLVDPNTGVSMKESTDIINYLYKNYSTCKSPS